LLPGLSTWIEYHNFLPFLNSDVSGKIGSTYCSVGRNIASSIISLKLFNHANILGHYSDLPRCACVHNATKVACRMPSVNVFSLAALNLCTMTWHHVYDTVKG